MADLADTAHIPSVMEDPSTRSVARVYAVALLDAAGSAAGEVLDEYQSFVEAMAGQPAFNRLLASPAVTSDQKLAILERVVAGRGSELFINFLRVLARHGRLELIPAVLDQARREQETRAGKRRMQVVSARPLPEDALARIQAAVAASLSAELIVETAVDPNLLGGVVIRIEDTIYDGSVRSRLKQLRASLRERCLHEVQRGRDRFSHPEGN
jgi:F-type H+-transporting ATPase subunit delta